MASIVPLYLMLVMRRTFLQGGPKVIAVDFMSVGLKLRRQKEHEQIRTATEKMKHCLIFSREIF